MYTEKSKKVFTKPECEVIRFAVEDILTTSNPDDWNVGDMNIAEIEAVS